MMRSHFVVLTGLLLGTQVAVAFEPGEKLVVIQPFEMKTITGSSLPLTMGTTVTVQTVEPERLKVAVGRVGWIDPAAVIAASKADDYFSKLVAEQSQKAAALLARGKVRFDNGDTDRAIADLDQSLSLTPSSEAETIRAYAWKRKGDKQKAMAGFNEAIRLDPKNALAWRIRGATWAGKPDYPKALADYSESIRIDPENPDSRHHRALLLSACNDAAIRNGKQAVEDATKACEVSEWKNALYLSGLASASAEAGDFDSAIKWQTKAIELSSSDQRTSQLEEFKQHKPFRMTWR
jgi:tetratricopeptide (TPR) repeat protein